MAELAELVAGTYSVCEDVGLLDNASIDEDPVV